MEASDMTFEENQDTNTDENLNLDTASTNFANNYIKIKNFNYRKNI